MAPAQAPRAFCPSGSTELSFTSTIRCNRSLMRSNAMTSRISVNQEFKGSIEKTWSTLIDIVQYPSRVKSYEAIEWLTSEKSGVGANWKQTRKVFGKSHTQTIEAVEWKEPTSFAMTATEAGATYLTRYNLSNPLQPRGIQRW